MNKLEDILSGIRIIKVLGNTQIPIRSIQFDSRCVEQDDVFVAIPGTKVDGHSYMDQALEKGAVAFVCQQLPESPKANCCYCLVDDSSYALGIMASNFHGNASKKLRVLGVTGTNGKTTVATLIYQFLRKFGIRAGLISTVQYEINDKPQPASHTTPDPLRINALLSDMVAEDCDYAIMEVSSHALDQNRVAGLHFTAGIFTNISHDHLDYHSGFMDYIHAKKKLFDGLSKNAFALVNADDRNANIMVQGSRARVYTYALKTMADFKGKIIEQRFDGTLLDVNGIQTWFPLVGEFNAYNLMAVFGCSQLLGFETEMALKGLSGLRPVKGRFECLKSKEGKTAIVDYAHTPEGLLNVLKTIHATRKKNQQLITVVGAGGDRDRAKRPEMAKIALSYSNKVILTNDNPRFEDPERIIEDMLAGVKDQQQVLVIPDRKEAIKTAIFMAGDHDIVLIAGKGHETYQEIKAERYHFDDAETIMKMFNT